MAAWLAALGAARMATGIDPEGVAAVAAEGFAPRDRGDACHSPAIAHADRAEVGFGLFSRRGITRDPPIEPVDRLIGGALSRLELDRRRPAPRRQIGQPTGNALNHANRLLPKLCSTFTPHLCFFVGYVFVPVCHGSSSGKSGL